MPRPTLPPPAARRCRVLASLLLAGACGGGATGPSAGGDAAPGPDTREPFPIDRGGDGPAAPGTYKGLPLRLVDNGEPTVTPVDGVIGLVCIGMSNGAQECDDFRTRVRTDFAAEVGAAVRVVNCAVGGHAIERWIDPQYDAELWDRCVRTVLPAAGVRPDQVRVVWHKAANQNTTAGGRVLPAYPEPGSDFERFGGNLAAFAARLPQKLPSVQAVYSSSRSYGGFSTNAGRGEPLSYEEGHALNAWLRANPRVGGVWHGWGAYLWAPACSTGGTNAGGVCYERADFAADGYHPAPSGRAKVGRLLHARFRRHAWYR